MKVGEKDRFMIQHTIATLVVVMVLAGLWIATGNNAFALAASCVPYVGLTVLAWKAGLLKKSRSSSR